MNNFTDTYSWRLLKAALIRALRTAAQTALAVIGSCALMEDVDWHVVVSSVALATIASLLMSIEGLPEVDDDRLIDEAIAALDEMEKDMKDEEED